MCCDYSFRHLFTIWHYLVYALVNLALGIPSIVVGASSLGSTCQYAGVSVSLWLLVLGGVSVGSVVVFGLYFLSLCCCSCCGPCCGTCYLSSILVLRYLVWLWKLCWFVVGAAIFWGTCLHATASPLFPLVYVALIADTVFVVVDFLVSCYSPGSHYYMCCEV
ncbi:MAG: hypothetical protein ACYCOU_03895 [Sulfobacillus sp.]